MTNDERRAYDKAYREKNKEKKSAQMKANYQANKEERKAKAKDYRESHKESIKEKGSIRKNKFYIENKEVVDARNKAYNDSHKEEVKAYSRTIKGLIVRIYLSQKGSSKERGHNPPTYSKEELHVWMTSQSNFKELYDNWIVSGHETDLRPSVDRLINSKGYSFDNIQLMTWRENYLKR